MKTKEDEAYQRIAAAGREYVGRLTRDSSRWLSHWELRVSIIQTALLVLAAAVGVWLFHIWASKSPSCSLYTGFGFSRTCASMRPASNPFPNEWLSPIWASAFGSVVLAAIACLSRSQFTVRLFQVWCGLSALVASVALIFYLTSGQSWYFFNTYNGELVVLPVAILFNGFGAVYLQARQRTAGKQN